MSVPMVKRAVATIARGRARRAVGRGPKVIPWDCSHQVMKIVIIVPNAIRSPWAKLANRKIPKIRVTPRAPSASWEP